MILTRRTILKGLLSAPIVCGSGVLMPVKVISETTRHQFVDGSYINLTETWEHNGAMWVKTTKHLASKITFSVEAYDQLPFNMYGLDNPAPETYRFTNYIRADIKNGWPQHVVGQIEKTS